MSRDTLGGTAHAARMATASRATLREVSHSGLWPQAKNIDVMHSETAENVEWAQNYGTTSWPMKQDEEKQTQQGGQKSGSGGGEAGGSEGSGDMNRNQPKGKSAEAVVIYSGGSRSHPVIVAMGDRRHQLMFEDKDGKSSDTGSPGDTAMHRTNDPANQQNVHLAEDGLHMLGVEGKKVRLGLVEKPDKMEHGQRPLRKKKSSHYIEVTTDLNAYKGKKHHLILKDGKVLVDVNDDGKVYLGAEKGKATFAKVMTEDGPSENVYAKVS